jgi:hypothetical protein
MDSTQQLIALIALVVPGLLITSGSERPQGQITPDLSAAKWKPALKGWFKRWCPGASCCFSMESEPFASHGSLEPPLASLVSTASRSDFRQWARIISTR